MPESRRGRRSQYENQREGVEQLLGGEEYVPHAFSTAIFALQTLGAQPKVKIDPEALFTTLSDLSERARARAEEVGDEAFTTSFTLLRQSYDLTLDMLRGTTQPPTPPASMKDKKG